MAAQLTTMDNVKVIFSEPDIEYKRINIKTEYPDEKIAPLIIPLKGCYSFGLQKNEKYGGVILCQLLLMMNLKRYLRIFLINIKSTW